MTLIKDSKSYWEKARLMSKDKKLTKNNYMQKQTAFIENGICN